MAKSQEYQEASRTLLSQAHEELAAGDLRQASEKGWGATAQILKAIAEERGIEHDTHRAIRGVLFAVAREALDQEAQRRIRLLFRSVSSLHINWYENWDSEEEVADGLNDVEELLGTLESAFEGDHIC